MMEKQEGPSHVKIWRVYWQPRISISMWIYVYMSWLLIVSVSLYLFPTWCLDSFSFSGTLDWAPTIDGLHWVSFLEFILLKEITWLAQLPTSSHVLATHWIHCSWSHAPLFVWSAMANVEILHSEGAVHSAGAEVGCLSWKVSLGADTITEVSEVNPYYVPVIISEMN